MRSDRRFSGDAPADGLAPSPRAGRPERWDRQPRVGIVLKTTPMTPLNTQKLHGILAFIRTHVRWRTHLFNLSATRREIGEWEPDGLIISRAPHEEPLDLPTRTIPTVYAHDGPDKSAKCTVSQDDFAIGRLAAAYFLDRKYERFAFVGEAGAAWSRERERGFLHRLAAAGREAKVFQVPDGATPGKVRQPKGILRLETPAAVFCANDFIALAALEACRRAGRAVPQELAVLGVDDMVLYCEFADPPLSSVVHPIHRVGYIAAEMLAMLMRREEPPAAHTRVPSRAVHTRRSTETPAVDDALVSDAIRWMNQRISRPLTVAEAARALGVSRNTLHRRFLNALGHGMKREHRRQQILRARELLRRTDEPLSTVATSCGFNDGAHFSRVFRSESGTTPNEYRARGTLGEPRPNATGT